MINTGYSVYFWGEKSPLNPLKQVVKMAWFRNRTDAIRYADDLLEDTYRFSYQTEVYIFDEEACQKIYSEKNYEKEEG